MWHPKMGTGTASNVDTLSSVIVKYAKLLDTEPNNREYQAIIDRSEELLASIVSNGSQKEA